MTSRNLSAPSGVTDMAETLDSRLQSGASLESEPEEEEVCSEGDEELAPPEPDVTASLINELMHYHVGLKNELRILQLLLDAPDINKVIENVNLKLLIRGIKNHKWRQSANHEKLLDILGKERVGKMNIKSKMLLIAAIARYGRKDFEEQRFVLNLFEATHGQELYELKHQLDHHAFDTTLSFVFEKLFTDPVLRDTFERYITIEADQLLEDPNFKRHVHALSDIDDTFVHSGYGLGGPKYPKGSVLPGVVTLFASLEAHLVFVTARPGAARNFTFKSLKKLWGVKNVSVLTGRLRDSVLIPFKPEFANEMIAARKLDNFFRHYQMFPECQFMWFGDSGQSDIEVGIRMMRHDFVLGAFIQDVAREDGLTLATTPADRAKFLEQKVYIADNYVNVALQMYASKLLSPQGLYETAEDAVIQLGVMRPQFIKPEIYAARVRELRAALVEVNRLLGPAGFDPLDMPEPGKH